MVYKCSDFACTLQNNLTFLENYFIYIISNRVDYNNVLSVIQIIYFRFGVCFEGEMDGEYLVTTQGIEKRFKLLETLDFDSGKITFVHRVFTFGAYLVILSYS